MEKIKIFQKKNMKISIMIFTIMIFSLFFIGKVNAKELTQFCEYTNPCLSTEMIDTLISNKNLDTSIYDSYIISIYKNFNGSLQFSSVFYKSEDVENGNIKFILSSDNIYVFTPINKISLYDISGVSKNNNIFNISNISLAYHYGNYQYSIGRLFDNESISIAYYSNKDILDENGNLILKANIEIEDEPEEEPITIINKMALFVNDIVVYFNENNISFYQILIGLFIFNFLVYVICYVVRRF